MTEIKTQLLEELAEVEWSDLKPHAQRDALIIVNQSLDLVEVGLAIAEDKVPLVNRWIQEQLLLKPSAEKLSFWNQQPETKFSTLIIQPFVLIKEIE